MDIRATGVPVGYANRDILPIFSTIEGREDIYVLHLRMRRKQYAALFKLVFLKSLNIDVDRYSILVQYWLPIELIKMSNLFWSRWTANFIRQYPD
jgi:hypothetical protein